MEAGFKALMPHTVTVEAIDGYDAYGVPSFTNATATLALVAPGRRRILRPDGQEVVARGVAYCAGPLEMPANAVITVPAEFALPDQMPVLDARIYADESGAVHNVELVF
jgi:hypothetical protein